MYKEEDILKLLKDEEYIKSAQNCKCKYLKDNGYEILGRNVHYSSPRYLAGLTLVPFILTSKWACGPVE